MLRDAYGIKRDQVDEIILPSNGASRNGQDNLRHRTTSTLYKLATFGLGEASSIAKLQNDIELENGNTFSNLAGEESVSNDNVKQKRIKVDGHFKVIIGAAVILTICTSILWYSLVWPWHFGTSNQVSTDSTIASALSHEAPSSNNIAIDSDSDISNDANIDHDGVFSERFDLNSRFGLSSVYESPNIAEGDKVLDAGRVLFPPPPSDHANPKLDKIAVVILTTQDTAHISIPTQAQTFLKQLKNFLVVSDRSGQYGGSETAGSVVNRSSTNKVFSQSEQGLLALQDLYSAFPDSEWFIVSRDNNYMFLDNIKAFLDDAKYDYKMPIYFGSQTIFKECKTLTQPLAKPEVRIGDLSSGIILSRSSVQKIVEEKTAKICIQKYTLCHSSDVVLGLCLADQSIRMTPEPRLNSRSLSSLTWPMDACQEPFSFPKTSPRLMLRIHSGQYATGVTSSGETTKWNHHINYANIFSHVYHDIGMFFSNPGYEIPGGDFMNAQAESGQNCQTLCKTEIKCLAWTYDIKLKTCWLKNTLSPKRDRQNAVSGVLPSRYTCNKDQFKPKKDRKRHSTFKHAAISGPLPKPGTAAPLKPGTAALPVNQPKRLIGRKRKFSGKN
ncbi:hypothetical protein QVD99_005324 [Batrachochytrium dendrobatidis]|nr:hypothetical protein O5D80_004341 [Batrachochytrium dendrobatidis]KAK5668291.1 hypothetical protein QVD99_005324 [Batrachochytrium dendrobatidis]